MNKQKPSEKLIAIANQIASNDQLNDSALEVLAAGVNRSQVLQGIYENGLVIGAASIASGNGLYMNHVGDNYIDFGDFGILDDDAIKIIEDALESQPSELEGGKKNSMHFLQPLEN